MSNILILGARQHSLGEALAAFARAEGHEVVTAGLGGETIPLDVVNDSDLAIHHTLSWHNPDHVLCTVGINEPWSSGGDLPEYYQRHFQVNVIGPMRVLEAWESLLVTEPRGVRHFVAISSNSARVPRQNSAAYCASKAALSQALRVKAREMNGGDRCGLVVYGYEPGLIEGTPMTADTIAQFGPGVPLTRMRGSGLAEGISRTALARMVVMGLETGFGLNGVLIPFDGGEA